MSERNAERKFYVERLEYGYYADRYETLKEAEEKARAQTVKNMEPYGIFKLEFKSEVPEIVHNVKIEAVK